MNFKCRNNTDVTINGVSYSGKQVSIDGRGKVIVDGVIQDGDSLVGDVKIEINGDVETMESGAGDVTISGSCRSVQTMSGDITCGAVSGNVKTMSGYVQCGNVSGSVDTMSGNVNHR